MKEKRHAVRFWSPVLLLAAVAAASAGPLALSAPSAPALGDLEPARGQSRILRETVALLEQGHLKKMELDDRFSEAVLERYLELLDRARSTFLAADVARFQERFGRALDEAADRGDLEPAFAVYNVFLERAREQGEFMVGLLETELAGLELDGDGTIEIDRSKAPWPASREEAEALWRKRFEDDVLRLRLADQDEEAVRKTLEKRYRGILTRISQTKSEDVLTVFANAITYVFDPHTVYFAPRLAENFGIEMSLSLEGIGALLGADGEYTQIQRLIPGGPAELSGELKPLDKITAVAQEGEEPTDVVGWRLDDVVQLIRGPKGTRVRLAILSEGQEKPRTIELVRDKVKLEEQAAKSYLLEPEEGGPKVGVIDLPAFYEDFSGARRGDPDYKSSSRDVAELVTELVAQGAESIVLDLRGNGGGSLPEAVALTGLFIGKQPVVQVRSAKGRTESLVSPVDQLYDGPLVVMVDRLSASASEILAGAIQDYGRGLVVGTRTFGKGTVQNVVPVGGGQVNLTLAKFYRVSGASTQLRGVEPDIVLPDPWDEDEVGEDVERTALPYDTIEPARFRADRTIAAEVPELARTHAERAAADPDYRSQVRRIELGEELGAVTALPLNEAERRAWSEKREQLFLAIENERRAAHGEEPLADLDELADEPAHADRDRDRDPVVEEAARIALDLGRRLKQVALASDAR